MWARTIELLIALWMLISYFFYSYAGNHLVITALIVIFAGLSFLEKLNKMHLLNVIPAFWLLAIAYTYPTPLLPFSYQSYILAALFLLLFAIIPSRASEPPLAWQRFKNLSQ